MKYAVIYQSKSGNTKMLAEYIFSELAMADNSNSLSEPRDGFYDPNHIRKESVEP